MAKIVVALGGNALGKSPSEQLNLVKSTAASLVNLITLGHQIVISHGNGPQVGAINLGMNFAAEHGQNAAFPLPECGAMSQGYIGYHLQQSLENELRAQQMKQQVVSLVTQVVVDSQDPAFMKPTKPVGAFYSQQQAQKIAADKGYTFIEDAGRGYRQVVASPIPQSIVELNSINQLIESGAVVIACGGGGIPVVQQDNGWQGVPAVIDKDRSSALLAANLKADQLIILTAVDQVYLNYNQPNQQALSQLTVSQAQQYIQEKQFAPGSMLPKIEACLDFVQSGPHRTALITSLAHLDKALAHQTGTILQQEETQK